jgi:hypothetical protein
VHLALAHPDAVAPASSLVEALAAVGNLMVAAAVVAQAISLLGVKTSASPPLDLGYDYALTY